MFRYRVVKQSGGPTRQLSGYLSSSRGVSDNCFLMKEPLLHQVAAAEITEIFDLERTTVGARRALTQGLLKRL